MSSNRRLISDLKKEWTRMDMDKARQIHDYYHLTEPYVKFCTNVKHKLAFQGGISIEWVGYKADQSSLTEESYDRNQDLIKLGSEALSNKDMFGFCPFKIIKDIRNGKVKIVIPEFGSGDFYKKTNGVSLQTEVAFLPTISETGEKGRHGSNTTHAPFVGADIRSKAMGTSSGVTEDSNEMDPNIDVFIWPGHNPPIDGNEFKSDIFKLYKMYQEIDEMKENNGDAEFNRTHPTVFLQGTPDNTNLEDMVERRVYAEDEIDSSLKPNEKETYIVEKHRAEYYHNQDVKNRGNEYYERINKDTRKSEYARRKRTHEDNIFPIKSGDQLAHQLIPQEVSHYEYRNRSYQEMVCLTMGIPPGYASSMNHQYKSDSQKEQHLLRATIEEARRDVELFYQYVYNKAYKQAQDLELLRYLGELDDGIKDVKKRREQRRILRRRQKELGAKNETEVAGKGVFTMPMFPGDTDDSDGIENESSDEEDKAMARGLKRAKHAAIKAAKTVNRVRLKFIEDPFAASIPMEEIITYSDRGILSPLEEVNISRCRMGLPPVEEGHPLVSENKKKRERKELEEELQLQSMQLNMKKVKSDMELSKTVAMANLKKKGEGENKAGGSSSSSSSNNNNKSESENSNSSSKEKKDLEKKKDDSSKNKEKDKKAGTTAGRLTRDKEDKKWTRSNKQ